VDRSKQLKRDILMFEWKRDWLKLLPRLEADLIELARLTSLQRKKDLMLAGVMRGVPGIPLDLTANGRETTAADIAKVIAFQTRLFEGQPPAGRGSEFAEDFLVERILVIYGL
jgi:hypothetical protein